MKTSILISSIAAFCMMITFGEAPTNYRTNKASILPIENFSFVKGSESNSIAADEIHTRLKNEIKSEESINTDNDFSYLKFNVSNFGEANSYTFLQADALPVPENEFSYLAFRISDFMTQTQVADENTMEMPEAKNSSADADDSKLSYLKFDINTVERNNCNSESAVEELPENQINHKNTSYSKLSDEKTKEYEYLKFNASSYPTPSGNGYEITSELPAN